MRYKELIMAWISDININWENKEQVAVVLKTMAIGIEKGYLEELEVKQ